MWNEILQRTLIGSATRHSLSRGRWRLSSQVIFTKTRGEEMSFPPHESFHWNPDCPHIPAVPARWRSSRRGFPYRWHTPLPADGESDVAGEAELRPSGRDTRSCQVASGKPCGERRAHLYRRQLQGRSRKCHVSRLRLRGRGLTGSSGQGLPTSLSAWLLPTSRAFSAPPARLPSLRPQTRQSPPAG